jgi:hypothetical protein
MPATALVAAWAILASGCGGTLEGKYRRGQITTSTTTGPRGPAGPGTTATTTATVPTSGNAAGPGHRGEPEWVEPGGTIVRSASWRPAVSPLGGRHR